MILFSMPDIAGNWDNSPLGPNKELSQREVERRAKQFISRARLGDFNLGEKGYVVDERGTISHTLFPGGFGGLANYGIEVGTCRTGYVEVNFYQSERQITEAIYFRKLLADAKISYREVPPLADVARDFARQPVQKSGFYKGLLRQVRKSKNSKGRRKG